MASNEIKMLFSGKETFSPELEKVDSAADKATEALEKLEKAKRKAVERITTSADKQLALIKTKAELLGDAFNSTGARTKALTSTLDRLVKAGVEPTNASITNLAGEIKRAKDQMDGARREADRLKEATDRANRAFTSFSDVGNKAANFSRWSGRVIAAVGAGVIGVGTLLTKTAMDAVESENLFEVSMGGMANAARAWSEQLRKQLGLNSYEVRKQTGMFNVMFESMGVGAFQAYDMAKGLTQLGYDMASFYNLRPDEAFTKLQAGITGEIEPLRRLGILVSKERAEEYALTHQLVKKGQALEGTNLLMARYGLIMESTTAAQGDLARTIDTPINRLRVFNDRIKNLSIDIGSRLIPVFSSLLDSIEPFVVRLERASQSGELDKWGKDLEKTLKNVISKAKELGEWFVKNWGSIVKGVELFVGAWAFSTLTAGLVNILSLLKDIKAIMSFINGLNWASSLGSLGIYGAAIGVGSALAILVHNLVGKKTNEDRRETMAKNFAATVPGGPGAFITGTTSQAWSKVLGNASVARQPSLAEMGAMLKSAGVPLPKPDAKPSVVQPSAKGKTVAEILQALKEDIAAAVLKESKLGKSFDLNSAKASALNSAIDQLAHTNERGTSGAMDSLVKRLNAVKREQGAVDSAEAQKKALAESANRITQELAKTAEDFVKSQKEADEYHQSVIDGYKKMGNDWRKAQVEKRKAEEEYHKSVIDGYKKMGDEWRKEQAEKRKADAEKAKARAEEVAEARRQAKQTLTGMVTSRLSIVGGVVQGAQAGAKLGAAAGPEGALIGGIGGALLGLITQSKSFERVLQLVNPILEAVANAFGQILEPILPIIQVISSTIGPIMKVFGNILKTSIEPVMPIIFNIVKGLGLVLIGLSIGIVNVKNTIIGAAQGILRGIGKFLTWVGLGLQDDGERLLAAADKMEGLKTSTDDLKTAFDKLKDMSYDKAKADADAAAASEAMMRNVPELFKVVAARNAAAKGIPAFASGGYVPASPGGTVVRVGEGGEGEYIVPKSKMGGVNITVNVNGSTNPTETKRLAKEGVFEALRQFGMAKYGTYAGVV